MYEILVPELRDDPLGRGYAAMNPQQVLDDLNTAYRTTTQPVTARQIVRWSASWDAFYSLKNAASGGQEDKRKLAEAALEMVSNPHIPDLDVVDPGIAGMFSALVSLGVLEQEAMDALKAMAVVTITRAAELGLSGVSDGNIVSAWEIING